MIGILTLVASKMVVGKIVGDLTGGAILGYALALINEMS